MDVGDTVYWSATTGYRHHGHGGDWVDETDHRVEEGRVVSAGREFVAVLPDERKRLIFLPIASLFENPTAAGEDAYRRNEAMFGHREGKWAAEKAGTLKRLGLDSLIQDLRVS